MEDNKRAKIVVIEGTDGSGKETQSKLLYEHLTRNGLKVKNYSFPMYGTPTGKIVGGPYLGKPEICTSFFEEKSAAVDPLVSCLYYAADRRYNFLREIEGELTKNDVVLLDRYVTSNMGHQSGKAHTPELRAKILKFIETLEYDLCELPKPDEVVFLHMPCEAAKELRKGRPASDGNEDSEEHQKAAELAYVQIAKDNGWDIIDCLKTATFQTLEDIRTIPEISEEVIQIVENCLGKENGPLRKMTRF